MKRWYQTNFFEIPLPLVPRRPHCLNEKAACRIDRRRFFLFKIKRRKASRKVHYNQIPYSTRYLQGCSIYRI